MNLIVAVISSASRENCFDKAVDESDTGTKCRTAPRAAATRQDHDDTQQRHGVRRSRREIFRIEARTAELPLELPDR